MIKCRSPEIELSLQAGLSLQGSAHSAHFLDHIPNLQPTLANLQCQLLPTLKPDGHDWWLRRGARQLVHLDIDVGWTAGWCCAWSAQQ